MENQLGFDFEPHKARRNTDPETSHLAAKQAVSVSKDHQRKILMALRKLRMAGASELALPSKLHPVQVTRRMSELERAGYVRVVTIDGVVQTKLSWTNRQERLWEITQKGYEELSHV